jgi:chemotaxis protein MotA
MRYHFLAMNRSNLSVFLGISIGFVALIAGFLIEGGTVLGLFGASALLIILGGTLGATLTSFTISDVVRIPYLFMQSMRMPRNDEVELVELFVNMSEKARREGLLVLETDVQGELTDDRYDPLIRKGVSLVVDGTDPELIRTILEQEIYGFEERRKREAAIFEAAGGFSPTMGIIGTVLGLIQVMTRLKDPSTLGPSIALAFLATLYGIALANLVWLPVANKLKLKMKIQKMKKEMIIAGVQSLQNGDNPRVVREKLAGFLEEDKRQAVESIGAASE